MGSIKNLKRKSNNFKHRVFVFDSCEVGVLLLFVVVARLLQS